MAAKAVTRSSVVRRVVASFALIALLPAAVTSALAYHAVEQHLVAKSLEQLRQQSKNYGLRVLQQLQVAHSLLNSFATLDAAKDLGAENSYFSEIVVAAPIEPQQRSRNDPDQAPRPPAAVRLEARHGEVDPGVWMSVKGPAGQLVSGRLNSSLLWGSPDTFPPSTRFCVLDERVIEIFCPMPPAAAAMEQWRTALRKSSVGTMRWDEGGEGYLSGYFTVPLQPKFASAGWAIATIEEESHALAAMAGFRAIFPPAIALTIVLSIWVSARQVRRRLDPLRVLAKATSTIAHGDFSKDVVLEGDDEFGSLADSFNVMRRDLERQFDTLRALAELDRQILGARGLQPIVESTCAKMREVFDCQCTAIAIVARDASDAAQVIGCGTDGQLSVDRIELSNRDRILLQGGDRVLEVSVAAAAPFLGPLKHHGARLYRVLPVFLKEVLAGAIVLGYVDDTGSSGLAAASLLDFGDRFAVALQALDRAERLYVKAHYDSITALPNRQLFGDRLELTIAQARAHGHISALLFIDLDHFKTVNDSEGHLIGDETLCLAAQRLRECVGDGDTVARLGGDEFTVILAEVSSPLEASRAAEKIIAALSKPFRIAVMEHFISASVGIAMIPADGTTVVELLRNADTALYKAKSLGRRRSVFFEDDMNRDAEERVRLGGDLRHAIARGELVLQYQPKFDLETMRVVGAEALLRWQHPTRGLIEPDVFVPIAEDSGSIIELGHWTINEASRQLALWSSRGVVDNLSVNVSYRQLRDGGVLQSLKNASQCSGLAPNSFEVEFTESMMVEDRLALIEVLGALRGAGFPIAIDDFGSGYSSFSYLSELPFDVIKLDKAFLDNFPNVPSRVAIVAGIIQMATVLGKSVVAEGVESEEQRLALLKYGCATAQGYLLSPASSPADFEALVARQASARPAIFQT
jgi:diguanylate cyclase (GGDEF)-like protein